MKTTLRLILPVLLLTCFVSARAQEYYFYKGRAFGSEGMYNPITLILNGSYDIIQHENRSREVFTLAYADGISNVFHNLASPFAMISQYGWWDFLRREVLPISFKAEDGMVAELYTAPHWWRDDIRCNP